jgi:hypothetical protein
LVESLDIQSFSRALISRGAFGDALKEVLCVPYAIADKKEIENWEA